MRGVSGESSLQIGRSGCRRQGESRRGRADGVGDRGGGERAGDEGDDLGGKRLAGSRVGQFCADGLRQAIGEGGAAGEDDYGWQSLELDQQRGARSSQPVGGHSFLAGRIFTCIIVSIHETCTL